MFNDRNQSLLEHNYRWKCDFLFFVGAGSWAVPAAACGAPCGAYSE